MSVESDRDELQALKDGFDALTRDASPRPDIDIAFTDQGRRRVGILISQAAVEERRRNKPYWRA